MAFFLTNFVSMSLEYSFVIPVYNRPEEIRELLSSMTQLSGDLPFEVVIVEDGSSSSSEAVIREFEELLNIRYLVKKNTGPGDSRNYGMQRAKGNYFLILDSDCLLPAQYLEQVDQFLQENFYHCFG